MTPTSEEVGVLSSVLATATIGPRPAVQARARWPGRVEGAVAIVVTSVAGLHDSATMTLDLYGRLLDTVVEDVAVRPDGLSRPEGRMRAHEVATR